MVYLAVLGAALWLWGARRLAGGAGADRVDFPLVVVFLADLYVCAAAWAWYGAYGFGCRRLSDCAPIFASGGAAHSAPEGNDARQRPRDERRRRPNRRAPVLHYSCVRPRLVGRLCVAFNLLLTDVLRRRALPSSGNEARPAYRSAEAAGAPAWLVRLLHHGYPFVQPAGWMLSRRLAPRPGHHLGGRGGQLRPGARGPRPELRLWQQLGLHDRHAEYYVVEGLLPEDSSMAQHGRPVGRHVRLSCSPSVTSRIPARPGRRVPPPPAIHWNGVLVPWTVVREEVQFLLPEALVKAHRVGELTLDIAAPPGVVRISALRLRTFTSWWLPKAPPPPAPHLPAAHPAPPPPAPHLPAAHPAPPPPAPHLPAAPHSPPASPPPNRRPK